MAFDGRLLSGVGTFAAVVEGGNFVRAGDALGLTASGVSRGIARLEAQVGVRLFDRTPRAVTLTDEGRRFYAQVTPLLAGLEEAAAEATGAKATARGRLKVNVDPSFARLVLAPRLPEFLAKYPALSLEIIVRDRLGDIVGEGFDVAVRFGDPEAGRLIARKLLDTRIIACASPAYLARHRAPRHPRDLENHECLMFRDPTTGKPFDWEFHNGREIVEVKARGRLIFNDLSTKLLACVAGLGIAQAVEFGLEDYFVRGELVQVLPDWAEERYPLYAYYLSRHLAPAKVRAFLDFAIGALAAPPPA
jgi:DNA-binding transcriptional LysR family regulator